MTVGLSVTLYNVAFWIYAAAMVCYLLYLIDRVSSAGKLGTVLLVVGWMIHTISLVGRTIAVGHPPFLNLYEYVASFTWGVVLVYLVLEFKTRTRDFGPFAVPLVTLFAWVATHLPSESNPTMPALHSPWRVPHIATAILAYASFGIAYEIAVMYLIRDRIDRRQTAYWAKRIPDSKMLDRIVYRVIAFGFLMQTALLITGAIWAQFAWGRYWGWDPKEVWALITWLIYAAYLHTRTVMGWRGRKSAYLAVVGFAATIFTLFGVSLLPMLSGLHSYAR